MPSYTPITHLASFVLPLSVSSQGFQLNPYHPTPNPSSPRGDGGATEAKQKRTNPQTLGLPAGREEVPNPFAAASAMEGEADYIQESFVRLSENAKSSASAIEYVSTTLNPKP